MTATENARTTRQHAGSARIAQPPSPLDLILRKLRIVLLLTLGLLCATIITNSNNKKVQEIAPKRAEKYLPFWAINWVQVGIHELRQACSAALVFLCQGAECS